MSSPTDRDWELLKNARKNVQSHEDVTSQQARAMLRIIDELAKGTKYEKRI